MQTKSVDIFGIERDYNDTEVYRDGFNGQERADEIAKTGNENSANLGQYDLSLGR